MLMLVIVGMVVAAIMPVFVAMTVMVTAFMIVPVMIVSVPVFRLVVAAIRHCPCLFMVSGTVAE
jgi:hypothetical protein